jgi:hypothetical protein
MYAYTRRRRIDPANGRAALAKAVELARMASSVTGFEVNAWTTTLTAEAGVAQWSVLFEHLVEFEEATGKLMADKAYGDAVEAADDLFEGPIEDALVSFISEVEAGGPAPAYVSSVRTLMAPGMYAAGVAAGMEIADAATKISGAPTAFGLLQTGPYGGVVWVTTAPDLATVERAEAALAAEPTWLELIDRVGHCYQPESRRLLVRRLT